MLALARRIRRVGATVLGIVAVVFVAELAVMGVLVLMGLAVFDLGIALLDGLLLAVLVSGPLYVLMVRPLRREHAKLLRSEQRARELDRLAMSDPLTGVLNRRGILARLLEAMAHAERYRRHLSVAMLDLDGFKAVNDRYGHAFGDQVLRRVAARFSAALRTSDQIGRLGGDEFLVVLPEAELGLAAAWAERVRWDFEQLEIEIDGVRVTLTVSIGVAELVSREPLGEILRRVDRALYGAKEVGRPAGKGAVLAAPGS